MSQKIHQRFAQEGYTHGAAELRDKGSIVSTSIFRAQKFPQVQLSSEQVVINLP